MENSSCLLECLIVEKLVKKLLAFYETRRPTAMFAAAQYRSLS
jgi:hypothetical protein